VQRVLVVGLPCSGKTTLSAALARRLEVAHIEVDDLHWGPGWTTREDFVDRVEQATAAEGWVADDWGTKEVRDLLWDRASTLVWLDPPRRVAESRAVRRTAWRVLSRSRHAGGNRDGLLGWVSATHPVRTVWSQYASYREDMGARLSDARWSHLTPVRLRTTAEIEDYLARS
jgi:adenylate kinase family enzyme